MQFSLKTASVLALLASSLVAGLMLGPRPTPLIGAPEAAPPNFVEEEGATQDLGDSYDRVLDVMTHPRCTNCHPTDDIPKQGLEARPHRFGLSRGTDDHGFEALRCATCHQDRNQAASGVPGAPHWGLAPASMGWQGMSRREVAEALLDRSRNGGRSHAELVEHMTRDPLVLWAWDPGVDAWGEPREPPPVGKEAYIAAVKAWFAQGAPLPNPAQESRD